MIGQQDHMHVPTWPRGEPWRRSELTDATLYARGQWPTFYGVYNAQLRNGFSRTPGNGTPPNWAVMYHHIVRPRFDNTGLLAIGMVNQIVGAPAGTVPPKTYADYIRPGTRGDSGKVRNIAAALQASAQALYKANGGS